MHTQENTDKPRKTASKRTKTPKTASSKPQKSRATASKSSRTSQPTSKRLKIALIIASFLALISIFFFDITRVNSNAMMPTLAKGDLVLSWAPTLLKPIYTPAYVPGDIVLVENENNSQTPNYLRLIANHDENISFHADQLAINGKPLTRQLLTNQAIQRPKDTPQIYREYLSNGANYRIMLPQLAIQGPLTGKLQAKDGAFLVGDNRMASYDARQTGLFSPDRLRGRALIVLESTQNDGLLAHWFKPIHR